MEAPRGGGRCSSYYSFVVIYFPSHSHVKVAMHSMATGPVNEKNKASFCSGDLVVQYLSLQAVFVEACIDLPCLQCFD